MKLFDVLTADNFIQAFDYVRKLFGTHTPNLLSDALC